MIKLTVRLPDRTTSFESSASQIRIGRGAEMDFVLQASAVSTEHARIDVEPTGVVLHDLRSTNGTAIERGGDRFQLGEDAPSSIALQDDDHIELGGGESKLVIHVRLREESEELAPRIVAVRPIADAPALAQDLERNTRSLAALYAAQKTISLAEGLDDTLRSIAEAALAVIDRATHVTIVLRDLSGRAGGAYVPMLTRMRDSSGGSAVPAAPVPLTRSIFRRVVEQRAAVLAADVASEVGQSESLLGAQIRSTLAVPLWKGEEILGVLQVDNRTQPGMLHQGDVEFLTVLAAQGSLAVAKAGLLQRLQQAEQRLTKENSFLKSREESRRSGATHILGTSAPMRTLLEQIGKVVDTRVTVLIEGETGVGKELVASALHYGSRRRDKLFVTQNCAALPENLLESELFGHKRGAFTGATEDRRGLFEVADGGTLFLDEVTELPLPLQAKLLRALQEGEVRPLGSSQTKSVNVRIVAATNRDMESEVAAGRFREDLLYRLRVFPLRVPPLRERRDDVPELAKAFLARASLEFGKEVAGFAQQTLELLAAYDWPGNVRELQNEVARSVIEVEPSGIVTPDLLSARIRRAEGVVTRAGASRGSLRDRMDEVEKYLLLESLREHQQNKTNAARALGITREGLHKKLRGLGIG